MRKIIYRIAALLFPIFTIFTSVTSTYAVDEKNQSKETYAIEISSDDTGEVEPSETIYVKYGESIILDITPNDGYDVDTIYLNGEAVDDYKDNYTYSVSNIKDNMSFYVSFKEIVNEEPEASGINPFLLGLIIGLVALGVFITIILIKL